MESLVSVCVKCSTSASSSSESLFQQHDRHMNVEQLVSVSSDYFFFLSYAYVFQVDTLPVLTAARLLECMSYSRDSISSSTGCLSQPVHTSFCISQALLLSQHTVQTSDTDAFHSKALSQSATVRVLEKLEAAPCRTVQTGRRKVNIR